MRLQERGELVNAGVAKTYYLIQVIPHGGVGVNRGLEVVEKHVLPLTTVDPVALASRQHGSIGHKLLQGVHTVGAAIESVANGRVDVGHRVDIGKGGVLEGFFLAELALGILVDTERAILCGTLSLLDE